MEAANNGNVDIAVCLMTQTNIYTPDEVSHRSINHITFLILFFIDRRSS